MPGPETSGRDGLVSVGDLTVEIPEQPPIIILIIRSQRQGNGVNNAYLLKNAVFPAIFHLSKTFFYVYLSMFKA